ncbi:PREDICTED: la-related protein 6B-like [Ipomoea nil]|uniref:la-related protein 6B-like n=1 Tax=Ipomoea nil TaxID=35883 RepID=UPI00090172F0|nr:PREDICTED: la-related protein 6B-like [Ipomoea nil]
MDSSFLSMVATLHSSATSSSSSLLDFDMDSSSSICISPPPHDLPSFRNLNSVSPPPPNDSHSLNYYYAAIRKQQQQQQQLNAEAPAFIPRSSSSPSLTTFHAAAAAAAAAVPPKSASHRRTPSASSATVPHHAKTTVMHVYTTPDGTTYHHITTHVPNNVQANNYPSLPQQPVQNHRQLLRSVSGGILEKTMGHKVAAGTAAASPQPLSDSDQGWKKLSDEACNKIVNQVEFYFSDLNLATTDHLIRIMSKDPEGYVPMSVVASFKKIKALVSSHAQLAKILRSSTKLVVSEDGKKVKRQIRLTETDMEELQSRIVIAENLPHDHCHQNLMKIFSAVGSVKMIRTCQPQTSSGGASSGTRTAKSDSTVFSNKLHAFVEYETIELAEKAIAELNDRNDWRNGLKVRPLLKRTAKSSTPRALKAGHESEATFKEDDMFGHKHQISSEHSESQSSELVGEEEGEKEGVWRAHNRGRGKGQAVGRPQFGVNNQRGPMCEQLQMVSGRQASVPRMPDGTRGFSMGRGKAIAIKSV